jgi:FkbM family methyltransferase
MKDIIQRILHLFGYHLSKSSEKYILTSQINSFVLQHELIKAEKPVIFDLGAYVGDVTEIYRKLFPLASIYCFEPFPQSFRILSKRFEGESRTFCHNTAVYEKKGTEILHSNLLPSTNSLLVTDGTAASFWGEGMFETTSHVEVITTTLDIFCNEAGIPHIDILKMDVQGAEFSVLMGAKEMLATQRISLIYTELMTCQTYKEQHNLHEYLSFLFSYGYTLLDFFNLERRNNQLVQADAVFLSSSFRKKFGNSLKST